MARGQFSKIAEIACLSGREFGADNSPHGVYVTRQWNWMNSFWILWKGRFRGARSDLARWAVSAIFEKWPFVIKPYFLLFEARISCVFLIFLLRSIKAYFCPIWLILMLWILVSVTLKKWCFFWRSVYMFIHTSTIIWAQYVYLFIHIPSFKYIL